MAIYFLASIAIAIAVGIVASRRGRVGYGWFLLGLVMPWIAGPLVIALPRQHSAPSAGAARALSVLKWSGITILFVGLTFIGMMLLGLFLIVQHGGG
jgi:hypothetical protein